MTDKLFEYKTADNWFVAKLSTNDSISSLGDQSEQETALYAQLTDFMTRISEKAHFAISVLQCTSDFYLLSFIVDLLNEQEQAGLKLTKRSGVSLISKDEQLVFVSLPKEGIPLSEFFGSVDSTGFGDKILIATRNEGKTKEFRKIFGALGYEVQNLNDYPDLPEVEETGTTFEENARLKAETISKITGKMVLADDSGLKVDTLGGLPGVWSARFSGPDATDDKNNAKLLHELAMVFDQEKRSAQFHTTLVVAAPDRESLVVEADWPGYIATQAKGDNGFGYDPLFLVGETGRHAAELTSEEKNSQSHRGQAVKKLMEVFPAWQTKQLS